jgi:hypothetical protein
VTNAESFVGWWRIDPVTGQTLGVAANGRGQSMTERGMLTHPLAQMAKNFAFEYAFCQAVPQALNLSLPFLHAHRDVLPWVAWLPDDPGGKKAGVVYRENKRACMIAAMVMTGITATLPLVILTLRYRQLARLGRRACFVAGTLIATATGPVPIEEVSVGDLVLSRQTSTGQQAYKTVSQVFVTLAKPVFEISVRDPDGGESTLKVTGEHPFWIVDRGWVAAEDLQNGHVLSTNDVDTLEVVASKPGARRTVYNLEIEDFHTYFVGPDGAWVHNACKLPLVIYSKLGLGGRLESVWARIERHHLGTGTPTTTQAKAFAQQMGWPGDHAGHAIARSLGGKGGTNSGNIFPLSSRVNIGVVNQFEQGIAREVRAGKDVILEVIPKYRGTSTRPFEVHYNVTVDGKTTTTVFDNYATWH